MFNKICYAYISLTVIVFFIGCSSSPEVTTEATTSPPVVLDGRILYPDGQVVEDQIVNVKLEPGPDTLHVGSGYFNIGVMYQEIYRLYLLPRRWTHATAPATLTLERGLNMLDFTIPHFVEGITPDPGIEQDTTMHPAVQQRRIEPPN